MSSHRTWMRLDNAATIYPASRKRDWMALFRLSAQLTEPVDPAVLQKALERTMRRFPAFSQRLRNGLFWHYLETIDNMPKIEPDVLNPCVPMDFDEYDGFMLRVRYYGRRIAVEFFHVLTDGTGGFVFLKTLVAEYLTLRYGAEIPRSAEILDCDAAPDPGELEDSYQKYARSAAPRSRRESGAYRIPGARTDNFMHITTGIVDAKQILKAAKSHHCTLTEYLAALLILSVDKIQLANNPRRQTHRPVKISIPVNLRQFYHNNTTRNFASYINPGIEPQYGQYTLEETIRAVRGQMAVELNEKLLNAKFSANVRSARHPVLRFAPLVLKNPALKAAFSVKGDRKTSTSISNLGAAALPPEMAQYVDRMDFLLGPLSRNGVACACLGYNGRVNINFTRVIEQPDVERNFFSALVKQGIHVTVESNQGEV